MITQHYFTVRNTSGLGFPVDMLRQDQCYPTSTEAVDNIDYVDTAKGTEVTLGSVQQRHWNPTHRRWESFGWQVVNHTKRGPA